MQSNTKLHPEQKAWKKSALAELRAAGGEVFTDFSSVTVAIKPKFPGSDFVDISIAGMSENEKKFRPSVGAYYALERMEHGECITVPRNGRTLAEVADSVFELATGYNLGS